MMITKEEYEQLLPYEDDFRRAVKAEYKLPTRKEEDDLVISILLKYEPRTQVNRSCPNCMFNIYKRMGWKFYEYQEWLEKNLPKEITWVEEPEVKKLKARVTRKKKEQ